MVNDHSNDGICDTRKRLRGERESAAVRIVSTKVDGRRSEHQVGSLTCKEVLQRQYVKFPNTRCLPERFCELASSLTQQQRGWVEEMGFGDLLKLCIRKVDRYLCLWLMQRFDPDDERLLVRENYSVDVGPNDVGWVLGLPRPNMAVPTDIGADMLSAYRARYSTENGIEERPLYEGLVAHTGSEGEFKELFLPYTLGVLLCPTQSPRISPMHLKVLSTTVEAQNYNWCEYVFDWLVVSAHRFKRSKSKVGGYGGCALFLMIFYVDRLNIGKPVNWSRKTSRVDAWTEKKFRDVVKKDRVSLVRGRCK